MVFDERACLTIKGGKCALTVVQDYLALQCCLPRLARCTGARRHLRNLGHPLIQGLHVDRGVLCHRRYVELITKVISIP